MSCLAQLYPAIEANTYHFANERRCTIQQGRLLKRMGVKRGVSDLFIATPMPQHHKYGLWIEIKCAKNTPTKEQKAFLEKQIQNNFAAACCWEIDAVIFVAEKYLSKKTINGYFDKVIYQKAV